MLDEIATLPLRSAEVNPDNPAFACLDEQVSYAELAERSLDLALFLHGNGVGRGHRVAILQPRSIESIIAIFGILRAGAAYVPIDPNAPSPRVARILRDCSVEVLITSGLPAGNLAKHLSMSTPVRLCVGEDPGRPGVASVTFAEALHARPAGRLQPIGPNDLAYVLFTSGSTGTPKGIAHTHASASAYVRASQALLRFDMEDRIAGISPLHFDQSTLDCFVVPYAGACTCIVPDVYSRFPVSLGDYLERMRVSVIYTVPYLLNQLLERGGLTKRELGSVRWVLFGGEPMHPRQLAALMHAMPRARFGNVYGPAEVNQCMFAAILSPPGPAETSVPIGQFWPEAEGLVVDEDGQPVLPGESGELLVASETMMQGYWARPDLTAASVAVRGIGGQEKRYYRTGDRVRQDEAGVFWFMGRTDRQVKVRGQRVELDEVESALNDHPDVESNAVYIVCGHDGAVLIEAAVLAATGRKLTERSLRAFLTACMTPAAVPERIEISDDLPLTGTGKIDRRALAESRQRQIDGDEQASTAKEQ